MAESLAHRWGQIIGDGFEMFVRNVLGKVAQRHRPYLDFKVTVQVCVDLRSAAHMNSYPL